MSEASWIKMRCNLTTDPRVVEIAGAVNLDEFGTVGRLHAVWAWLDQHSQDGTNVRISSAFLDRLTACRGFADAMRTVDWLSGRDQALTFPGYSRHNGPTAKARASETKRKDMQRERDKRRDERPNVGGTNVPDESGLEERREEKKEREEAAPPSRSRSAKKEQAKKDETEQAWLDRLITAHPSIDVRAQLELARRHRAKEGKPLERAWFEFAWLKNASEEVGGSVRTQAEQEPQGWREIVRERWPDAPEVESWSRLPGDVRREVLEALKEGAPA